MFKVICKINKLVVEQLNAISRYDCQPCEFSDYQMFDDHYDIQERTIKAMKAALLLEAVALDIAKPEYKNLANKLHYLDDLTDYRFIMLFDESAKLENVNVIFGSPWIYSAIIRNIKTDPTEEFITNTWQYISSWFVTPQQSEVDQNENFKTLWEKQFLFRLSAEATNDRLKGTIIKSDYQDGTQEQYYAIDTFFLMHLLSGKQNSQCIPLNNNLMISDKEDSEYSASAAIYDEFKANLPKLFGFKYLETLNNLRNCAYFSDDGVTIKATQILKGTGMKYTLDLAAGTKQHSSSLNYIEICQKLGGILLPINLVVKKAQEQCTKLINSHSEFANDILQEHIGSNELYHFNCLTFNETLSAIGNIEDLYIY